MTAIAIAKIILQRFVVRLSPHELGKLQMLRKLGRTDENARPRPAAYVLVECLLWAAAEVERGGAGPFPLERRRA